MPKVILIPYGADTSHMSPMEVYASGYTAWCFAQGVERRGYRARVFPMRRGDSLAEACKGVAGVINLCDGDPGEPWGMLEATRALEQAGVKFTGETSQVFEVASDRKRLRDIFIAAGINVPSLDGFPQFAKPKHLHGSIHITHRNIIRAPEEKLPFTQGPVEFYFEQYLEGPEYTVTIWEDKVIGVSQVQFSPGAHIISHDRKWVPDSDEAQHPPSIILSGAKLAEVDSIVQQALAACRAIGGGRSTRVDVRLGGGVPYVIDINPNPYLGPDGFSAKAFEAVGVDYPAFVDLALAPLLGANMQAKQPAQALGLSVQRKERPTWCGVACLQAIAAFHGASISQEEVFQQLPASEGGYDPEQLTRAASHLGYTAFYLVGADFALLTKILERRVPLIVSYQTAKGGHYSVLTGIDKDFIYLQDPNIGGAVATPLDAFRTDWFENYAGTPAKHEIVVVLRKGDTAAIDVVLSLR